MVTLQVEDLTVRYGDTVAVRTVDFTVEPGEFVALVGESGAGKSTLGLAVVGLAGTAEGSVRFSGRELLGADSEMLRSVRGSGIGLAFQDADDSLHPAYTVGEQVAESIDGRRRGWRRRHGDRVRSLLESLDLEAYYADRYPHELSGGQKQRALFAVALAGDPDLLVADEPTTGLDTVTQARVLDTLEAVAAERDLGVLFITHDLGVVAERCERVLVMRDGCIVDRGPTVTLLVGPEHPYTARLIEAATRRQRAVDGGRRQVGEVVAELDDVSKRYREGSILDRLLGTDRETEALLDASVSVRRGETVAFVGRSGAGKTTAARLLAGLETPTDGTVRLFGEPAGPVDARTGDRRRAVGYVFQSPRASLDPRCRVGKSVAEPLSAAGWDRQRRRERVAALLAEVGLAGYADRYPGSLSGGEAQRVAVARALAPDPDVLVLDEPTSALDTVTASELCETLARLTDERDLATLLVTHELGVVARLADRTCVLSGGRIVDRGPTADLLEEPTAKQTRALVESAPILPT